MYSLVKFLLFRLKPETAHHLAMRLLHYVLQIPILNRLFRFERNASFDFAGITFQNRLGIAAGFDKNAEYISDLVGLGFGHVEIGTVTPLAQDGNPQPRLFRLINDQALMNRMGFNNQGVDAIVKNLKNHQQRNFVIGGNIGKNKITSNEDAYKDYLICFEKMYDYVDYFVVNVSSPNTPNLRELQDKDMLTKIFMTLNKSRFGFSKYKPILLKIAPDLGPEQLDQILEVYEEQKIDALIVANTTIDYQVLEADRTFAIHQKMGGISGQPLHTKTLGVVIYLKSKKPDIRMIGVGGIDSAEAANRMIDAGCQLVQIYTGFIYHGPNLVQQILRKISN